PPFPCQGFPARLPVRDGRARSLRPSTHELRRLHPSMVFALPYFLASSAARMNESPSVAIFRPSLAGSNLMPMLEIYMRIYKKSSLTRPVSDFAVWHIPHSCVICLASALPFFHEWIATN